MKKRVVPIIFFGMLVLVAIVAILLIINAETVGEFTEILAIVTAIVSVLITMWIFRLKFTLDKIQSLTLNPDAARYVVTVLVFIDSDVSITRESVETDKELFASVIYLLGFGDDLAIAIDKHLVDERLTKDMIGGLLVRVSKSMIPYIKELRKTKGDDVYQALLAMYERWRPVTENETKYIRLD